MFLKLHHLLDRLLSTSGISYEWLSPVKLLVLLAAFVLVAYLLFRITSFFILKLVHSFIRKTSNTLDDALMEHRVFRSFAHLVPVLLLQYVADDIFMDYPDWLPVLIIATEVYLMLVLVKILLAFLRGMETYLAKLDALKDKPIASYFQLTRIILYIATVILVLSVLMERSPIYFLSAFGAMTAILLLIFKDTILGLVASVQISANDMVQVGDWIEMPKFNADGDVLAINLNTVKVSNWDKTITTVPTYYFITESFKNWRGMQQSGGRRIKRALYLNIRSIKFVDETLRRRLLTFALINEFVLQRQTEIEDFNRSHNFDTSALINGRRMTNVGVFRYYVEAFLTKHPGINQNMTLLVRQLAPDAHGLPIEIYCFTSTVSWLEYEPIQADIFDHLLAAAPQFDLEIFQAPAGSDIRHAASVVLANDNSSEAPKP